MKLNVIRIITTIFIAICIVFLLGCINTSKTMTTNFPTEIYVGFEGKIEMISDYENDEYTYQTSNSAVLTIDNLGMIRAISAGKAVVSIKNKHNATLKHDVEVLNRPEIETISLSANGPFYVGETYKLELHISPKEALSQKVIYSSDANIIFNEEKMEISFTRAGTFKFKCYSYNDLDITYEITFDVDYNAKYEIYHLLFIGNSLTKHTYDIPDILKNMMDAQNLNSNIITDSSNPQWIIDHKLSFLNHMRKYRYTHVILQEQSNGPISDYEKFRSAVLEFDAKIKEDKAKTVLYQTWAYDFEDEESRKIMHDLLKSAYTEVAELIGATLSPVGDAFAYMYENYTDINLYADLNHPSLYGAYLSACVHYGTITGKKASDNTYLITGIDSNTRTILQEVADLIVFNT